jgi:hypothetical protein
MPIRFISEDTELAIYSGAMSRGREREMERERGRRGREGARDLLICYNDALFIKPDRYIHLTRKTHCFGYINVQKKIGREVSVGLTMSGFSRAKMAKVDSLSHTHLVLNESTTTALQFRADQVPSREELHRAEERETTTG